MTEKIPRIVAHFEDFITGLQPSLQPARHITLSEQTNDGTFLHSLAAFIKESTGNEYSQPTVIEWSPHLTPRP